jgi:hypothetical protein
MKLRPQVQLRFRDERQWESCKSAVSESGVSLNEWVLLKIEGSKVLPEKPGRTRSTADRGKGVDGARTSRRTGGREESDSTIGLPLASPTKTKRMSTEEFFKLSNSDQDRARREGRY